MGSAQLRAEPLGRRQIETADGWWSPRSMPTDPMALPGCCATLRPAQSRQRRSRRRPMAARPPCRRCRRRKPRTCPICRARPASRRSSQSRIALGDDVDWTAFTVWLSALLHARGDDVMRVKGVVRTPAGRLLLQSVRKMVQRPEILPEQDDREDDMIVVIGRGYEERDLRRSLDYFVGKRPGLTSNDGHASPALDHIGAAGVEPGAPARLDHDGRRHLLDDGRAGDASRRRRAVAVIDRRFDRPCRRR